MKVTRTIALTGALLLLAGRARAGVYDVRQDEQSVVAAHPNGIGVDFGFASAVGALGVTYTRAFDETIRLEAGLGLGFSGTQLSLMPKFVFGGPRDHFVTGLGLAVTFPTDGKIADGNPVWLNYDALGYEHQFESGIGLSFAVGIDYGIGGGRFCILECEVDSDKESVRGMLGFQGRIGVAYWF